MAASKHNPSDDEPDWISSDGRNSKSKGVNGFALGGTVLVMLLLMGVFILWQREQSERRQAQAEWEQSVAMERAMEQHEAEERLRVMREDGKMLPDLGPDLQTVDDLNRAFRLANAGDDLNEQRALKLYAAGMMLLDDDLDGAVDAFRKAAALDPKYAEHFEKALKLQTERDRTAPQPREVK
ncbi:MAG: hypothetical protein K8U57_26380 [Planctomycetes bacterium]|nr:hypothetical protein [Planctomycetota bacterium]